MSLYFVGEIKFAVSFFRAKTMSFYKLRIKYGLEGSSNYIAWKDRMEAVLEGNGLKEFIDTDIPMPPTTNAQDLAQWKKCVAKARRIILEGVRDHIVSNLHGKESPYAMWKVTCFKTTVTIGRWQ